ncbi:hypothetical protein KP509_24G063300 [Ceratopteris richardii]|uniref:Nucleolar protein 6 n=1 Tax=Ceratopteris richardii TaxID=49495 RepID=A0A8T2RX57_CERRI|nr:hypothetical protein KP509_24G063300 [Ceratopteris richardii]
MPGIESSFDKPSFTELKVEELLKEVRVNYPPQTSVQTVVLAITSFFQTIPEHQVKSSLAPSFVDDLGVLAEKATFTFKSPKTVEVIGSFSIQGIAKPSETIDLAIQIPKSCFHEKDFSNHRYHAKRALYLVALRNQLKKCHFVKGMKWTTLHNDARKPLLLLKLGNELGVDFNFDVCLIPTIGQEVFNISKLAPSRNNLKLSSSGQISPEASPQYNMSIIEDIDMQNHSLYLRDTLGKCECSSDAILLLKVWMRQRKFPQMHDSLNGFIMTMLLAYLISTGDRKITSNMNATQAFRVCIESIAGGILEKPLFLIKETSRKTKEERKAYSEWFEAVMMDNLDCCNIAYYMTKSSLVEIKTAARATLAVMKHAWDFGFDEIFMTGLDFSPKFDYHLRISMKDQPLEHPSFADEGKYRDIEKQIARVLDQGIGNRAALIRVYGRVPPPKWDVRKGVHIINELPVFVGIMIKDYDSANRMVEIGPSADDVDESGKFRTFWGEKAELRRFKDGKINETAVWECDLTQRHLILPKIIEYLIRRHLSVSPSCIHVSGGQLDYALMDGKKDSSDSVRRILLAFDVLSKQLRALDDLPLRISSVQPLHAAFRHAAVFPPEFHILASERLAEKIPQRWCTSCVEPLEIMIQLEGSGKWPTNPDAIEKTKASFCLKIAESMKRIHGIKCIAAEDSVDLLMHGFCFRLRLHHEKDRTLVNARTEKPAMEKSLGSKPDSNSANLPLHKDLSLQSLHSSMLSALQGRYPVYGPTVRLAKRWIASHLFSDVLKEEVIELLVAYLFLRSAPYSPPLSRVTGFIRFLLLIRDYAWYFKPLIVDLNEDFTSKDYELIMDEFHAGNKTNPAMFIASPYDMRSRTWTVASPDQFSLKRLVAYARTSAELLEKLIEGDMPERWPSIFCTPSNLYDIILKVQPQRLSHPHRVLFPVDVKSRVKVTVKAPGDEFNPWLLLPALKGDSDPEKKLLVGFNPTCCLINDIKVMKFGGLFTYWYDHFGGGAIYLNWKSSPGCKEKKKSGI